MADPTGRESDKFMLRLPDGMRDRIKAAAAHNGRSMNTEIIHALTYWLEIELPYDVELGAGTDATSIGKQDSEETRKEREQDYKREIERSIWMMQRLLRDISVGKGSYEAQGGDGAGCGDGEGLGDGSGQG